MDDSLHKIHVVVTDAETGEMLVNETHETVLLIMSNYEDRFKNGKVSVLQYTNGSNIGIAEAIKNSNALSLAYRAVGMAKADVESKWKRASVLHQQV